LIILHPHLELSKIDVRLAGDLLRLEKKRDYLFLCLCLLIKFRQGLHTATHILLKSYGNSIMATFFTETNIIDGKIR